MREARFSVFVFFLLEEIKVPLTGTREKERKGTPRPPFRRPVRTSKVRETEYDCVAAFFVSCFRFPLRWCLYLVSEEATRNGFFGSFVDSRVTPPRRGKGLGKGGVPATSPRSWPRVALVRTFN